MVGNDGERGGGPSKRGVGRVFDALQGEHEGDDVTLMR